MAATFQDTPGSLDGNNNEGSDIGDGSGGSTSVGGGGPSRKSVDERTGGAVVLPFPAPSTDFSTHLSPLRDNHSTFHNVAKSCLFLNQFASHGSSASIEDTTSLHDSTSGDASTSVFHDGSFAFGLSEAIMALLDCIRDHDDRRCRIMACKTSAIVGRSAFARLRHSRHLWSTKAQAGGGSSSGDHHNTVTAARLEDEVGTDVPMALVTCALDDRDDGVAAAALEALGYLVLSTTSTLHTLVEDELLTDLAGLVSCARPTPYAPSLSLLTDEDSKTPLTELQTRVLDNILAPRMLQITSRLAHFGSIQHVGMALPMLTAGLVHVAKTSPATIYQMDRSSYSKRWVELDYVALIDAVVRGTLLPIMQASAGRIGIGKGNSSAVVTTKYVGSAAAMATIRLANACPTSSWNREAIDWAILVLKEEHIVSKSFVPQPVEAQLTSLATLLIASRAVPLLDRVSSTLLFVMDCIKELPYSTRAPIGVTSAGLLFDLGTGSNNDTSSTGRFLQYRSPCRPALLAEIALSFFMDGPVEDTANFDRVKVRSDSITHFLKQCKILNTNDLLREELVTSFCTVAFHAGRRHSQASSTHAGKARLLGRQEGLDEWLWLSISLLRSFRPCVGWGGSPSYMEEEVTMLVSCQVAYTRLLQQVLYSAGLLNPACSISVKFTPSCLPPSVLWSQLEEASEFLEQNGHMPVVESIEEPLRILVDDIVKTEVKGQGIVSHHMRLYLLSLAADQWVQQAQYFSSQKTSSSSDFSLNSDSAKNVLVAISPRRFFNKLKNANQSIVENYSKNKKDRYKRFAMETVTAAVACIENMALTACYISSRFGGSTETKEVLNLCVQSLKGRLSNDSEAVPVLPVCQSAIDRVEATFKSGGRSSSNYAGTSSLLPNTFKRRQIISSSRINQGNEVYEEGYLAQLSRQLIEARVDRCILTYPLVANFPAAVRKQNWLRLSTPPLPASRNPQITTSLIPKFVWGDNVTVCSAGSDPTAITLAHCIRRVMRYDGEEEFRLLISLRAHNVAAAEIPDGVRLDIGIIEESVTTSSDSMDPTSIEIQKALERSDEDVIVNSLTSAAVVYRNELKSGDHVTWELTMNPLNLTGMIVLQPSITYRAMEAEPPLASWVTSATKHKDDEETSVTSGLSQKSGSSHAVSDRGDKRGIEQKENVVVPCQPVRLSPMIGLQPDPLVFFRDSAGDLDCFRYLWSRMPFQLPQLKLSAANSRSDENDFEDVMIPVASNDALRLAGMSTLRFSGDTVPGGMVTRLWAFASPQGKRAMFVLAEQGNDKSTVFHVRGDDRQLLLLLTGTSTARRAVVSALQPGFDVI